MDVAVHRGERIDNSPTQRGDIVSQPIHQRIAQAYIAEFNLSCDWQTFHTFARKSGLSGGAAAKRLRVLLAQVTEGQAVQKVNPPTSAAWNLASDKLRHAFAELATGHLQ